MGVDYSPVGGVGVEVTKEIKKKLIVANDGDYDGDMDDLLSELGLTYAEAGDGNYTGDDNRHYIILEGDNFSELSENALPLISKLEDMGINIEYTDLKVLNELHIW